MDLITTDRIIEMAWEDRTPFEAIHFQFGVTEAQVIELMRRNLKRSSFNLWRKRVNSGVSQKHLAKRSAAISRFKCTNYFFFSCTLRCNRVLHPSNVPIFYAK